MPAFLPPEKLRADLASVRESFSDLGDKPLPIGVGFIAWLLDTKEETAKQMIDVVLESNVKALWLAFGNDVHRWIEYARTSPANAQSSHKPLIFVQVTSVEEALLAANEWKADVIVAQGVPIFTRSRVGAISSYRRRERVRRTRGSHYTEHVHPRL